MSDDFDPTDLRALAQAKATAADEVRRARQVEIDDIRWLMKQKQGRRVMWRLLEKAGFFRLSFTGARNGTDFNEGMRNVGLMLLDLIDEACPEQFGVMKNEHTEYVRSTNADRRKSN